MEQAKETRKHIDINTYKHTTMYMMLGDLGTEIECGYADVDICIYMCLTERERKVTTKHENPQMGMT